MARLKPGPSAIWGLAALGFNIPIIVGLIIGEIALGIVVGIIFGGLPVAAANFLARLLDRLRR